jgi:hypothetical protein
LKKKIEGGIKIWKVYRKYQVKKIVMKNLKIILRRIGVWRALDRKQGLKVKGKILAKIKIYVKAKIEEERLARERKIKEEKLAKEEEAKKKK